MPQIPRADHLARWDWPLPDEPYVPGRNRRPSDDDDVHRIARAAPAVTDPDRWQTNSAYLAGLRLYAHGFFWEAHEAWEPVWMGAVAKTRERFLLQGLIQLANAGLKLKMGRPAAAGRLARLASMHLREATYGSRDGSLMAIDLSVILGAAEAFAAALDRGRLQEAPAIPLRDPLTP